MNAQIEVPALQMFTNTDYDGNFFFHAIPVEPRPKLLRVRAKGREFSINTEKMDLTGDKLIIRLPMEE
jgi:hypothetical protein